MRYVLTVAALTLVYALTLASFDPLDLLMGAALGTVLVVIYRKTIFDQPPVEQAIDPPSLVHRALYFIPFCLAIVWDITVGTWEVLLIVLGVRPLRSPGIVRIPIGERTPMGVAVSGMATTLSPGTVLIDVDWERGDMLIHAIDASDPDKVRYVHQRFYERYQRHVFP